MVPLLFFLQSITSQAQTQMSSDISDSLMANAIDIFGTATTSFADAVTVIATGIGSVMMMIVMFYYITSILDGGKFQAKMLVPLILFVFVCNSSWISKPVVSFITTVTDSLQENLRDKTDKLQAEFEAPLSNPAVFVATIKAKALGNKIPEVAKSAASDTTVHIVSGGAISRREHEEGTRDGIISAFGSIRKGIVEEIGPSESVKKEDESVFGLVKSYLMYSWMSVGATFLAWIVDLFRIVIVLFANAMIAIILALTPIVFAFAMFPGHSKFIVTWFIRLCQFSLYSPLCLLVNCFSAVLFINLCKTGFDMGFLIAWAGSIVNLLLIFCIPSLASFIIEGASGSVSLSQALQSSAKVASYIGSAGMLAATTVLGADRVRDIKDTVTGIGNRGIGGMVQDVESGGVSGLGAGLRNAGRWVNSQGREGGFGGINEESSEPESK